MLSRDRHWDRWPCPRGQGSGQGLPGGGQSTARAMGRRGVGARQGGRPRGRRPEPVLTSSSALSAKAMMPSKMMTLAP